MHKNIGWVAEVILNPSDLHGRIVKIACEPDAIPEPGQYVKAWSVEDAAAPLATNLFASGYTQYGFVCSPPVPENWQPGTAVKLEGPFGQGFRLPDNLSNLALVSLCDHINPLLPLAERAINRGYAVTLFSDRSFLDLPLAVEAYPLSSLPDMLSWADTFVFDSSRSLIPKIRSILRLGQSERLAIPAQILVETSMPCSGLGDCGACAVPLRRGWGLACREGPVFNLEDLDW